MGELSESFKINVSGVSGIVNRKTWRELKDEQGKGKWFPKESAKRPRRAQTRTAKRLTREQATAIRKEYAKGDTTQAQIAAKYGISSPAVSSIINKRTHSGKTALVKIAPTEYAAIIQKYKSGKSTVAKIAESYAVSQPAIWRVINLHSDTKAKKAKVAA